ncbi:MAG TPA: trehalose-6-phosphate synthase [Gemmatimonadales bacterium]|nr:trehalose-6-phosphate synthase [Gemmatimonadales bacterium]
MPSRRRRTAAPTFVLVSNREPVEHQFAPDGSVTTSRPAGGLVTALQPVVERAGGTWVAWGSGSADFAVADAHGVVGVPPEAPRFHLRRIRLTDDELDGYYLETANRALWPLCHYQFQHFAFDRAAWRVYRQVNERFARAALAAVGKGEGVIWVQDYHLACVPGFLRQAAGRRLFVHQFWHIPWPGPDVLRALPVARRLVEDLLGNDLLVFQTQRHQLNFMASVADLLPKARVDWDHGTVEWARHRTTVRAVPISVDVAALERRAARREVQAEARRLRRRLVPPRGQLILGVDRVDYTKGMRRRFDAFARLLEIHPELRGRVTFLQVAPPSRSGIPAYATLQAELQSVAHRINARFGTPSWKPVDLRLEAFGPEALAACYRAADVCFVSSLQDGMNLVAKEFIACQRGGDGVLVLSEFAGAAEDMAGAVLINPYDVGSTAEALARALKMSPRERAVRLAAMRRQLRGHTIHDWTETILREVDRLRRRR